MIQLQTGWKKPLQGSIVKKQQGELKWRYLTGMEQIV